jgi:hypothetical protein
LRDDSGDFGEWPNRSPPSQRSGLQWLPSAVGGEPGHIQGSQKFDGYAVVGSVGPRRIDADNSPLTFENKVIGFLCLVGVVDGFDVEIDYVARGKRRWLFALKIDAAQADILEKPRCFLRPVCRVLVLLKF